jgi:hypothetical protein
MKVRRGYEVEWRLIKRHGQKCLFQHCWNGQRSTRTEYVEEAE